MEENVALDSKKKQKFLKSIRGIKKLIKKNEGKPLQKKEKTVEKIEPQKRFSMKLKDGKIKKRKRRPRGLVYLSHIPHGFYEHQMVQYFKQFGVVTNARVIRSKRTGTSKGYAFVEFREPAVGQIVAETMNNYLMGKRLIKAAYIPPEKQRVAYRKHWNNVSNPGTQRRMTMKKAINAVKDEKAELKKARKLLANLTKNKKKLSEIGINYDFFMPVDIPEVLLNDIVKQEKNDEDTVKEETDTPTNKIKNEKDSKKSINKDRMDKTQNAKQATKITTNTKDSKKKAVEISKNNDKLKTTEKEIPKQNKKEKAPVKVNKKEQKQKKEQLKSAGIKPLEEFVKVGEDSDDSDSSYDFDSDEYEKVLEAENSGSSDEGSDESDDEIDEEEESDEDDEVDIPTPPKKAKQKPLPKQVQATQSKKQEQKAQLQKPQAKKPEQKKPVEVKRKIPQKAVSPKKQKFEKVNQKPLKKQFKKK